MTSCERTQLICQDVAATARRPLLWCSAGKHSLILLHLWRRLGLPATVLFNELDGGFPGIREHLERCCLAWGVEQLHVVHPSITFDEYVQQMGYPVERVHADLPAEVHVSNAWQCTWTRQGIPLLVTSITMGADALVVGTRAADHPVLAALGARMDASDPWGIIRYNPLYAWSTGDVWAYIEAHHIPLPSCDQAKRESAYIWPDCLACTRRPEHWTMLKEQYPEVYARYWPQVAAVVGEE